MNVYEMVFISRVVNLERFNIFIVKNIRIMPETKEQKELSHKEVITLFKKDSVLSELRKEQDRIGKAYNNRLKELYDEYSIDVNNVANDVEKQFL